MAEKKLILFDEFISQFQVFNFFNAMDALAHLYINDDAAMFNEKKSTTVCRNFLIEDNFIYVFVPIPRLGDVVSHIDGCVIETANDSIYKTKYYKISELPVDILCKRCKVRENFPLSCIYYMNCMAMLRLPKNIDIHSEIFYDIYYSCLQGEKKRVGAF